MKFEVGDRIKVNQETLDATKRQRTNGKHIGGRWISWSLIKSGREGAEFIVTRADKYNVTMKKILENGELQNFGYYSNSFFIHVDNPLDSAEDF